MAPSKIDARNVSNTSPGVAKIFTSVAFAFLSHASALTAETARLWGARSSVKISSRSRRMRREARPPSATVLRAKREHDLVVIGAGPVGVQAAMRAMELLQEKKDDGDGPPSVVLVDAPRCTGVLISENGDASSSSKGCVDLSIGGPTGLFSKALRDTSKTIKVSTLRGMGLREDSIWNEIINSCTDLAASNANDCRRQLNFSGVTVKEGFAFFTGNGKEIAIVSKPVKGDDYTRPEIQENIDELVTAKNILIATGSKPFRPKDMPFDGKRVFDSDSINGLKYLPKSIAITGSGIVAIEFAKIFKNLGTDVTLIIRDNVPRNALKKIGLDIDLAAALNADLIRSGIKIERGAQVAGYNIPDSPVKPIVLTLEGRGGGSRPTGCATEISCDTYLAAVGRVPNTKNMNLESIGVELDSYGCISVDGNLCSSLPGIYAAGDVLGRPFLASTGVAQGIAAVNAIFATNGAVGQGPSKGGNISGPACSGDDAEDCEVDGDLGSTGAAYDPASLASNPFAFPVGVWSSPEAAYYGLSLEQAKEMNINAGSSIALYSECLRGVVFSPNGLLKLVFEKPSGRILGVHIVGDDACELIHYGMELVRSKRTINDVISNMYSAVTFHELYRIAANAAQNEVAARKRRAAAGAALAAANRRKSRKK